MTSNLMPRFLILVLFLPVLFSCGARREAVVLEGSTTSASQKDAVHYRTDTLLMRDSVLLWEKGDTVRIREVRYSDRLQRLTDTVRSTDTLYRERILSVPAKPSPRREIPLVLLSAGVTLFLTLIYRKLTH